MTAMVRCTSGAAGPILHRIMICIRVFLCCYYHCVMSKFDVKIFDGTQCQKKYEAEVHFYYMFLAFDVIFLPCTSIVLYMMAINI
jgi:hypothetical protein